MTRKRRQGLPIHVHLHNVNRDELPELTCLLPQLSLPFVAKSDQLAELHVHFHLKRRLISHRINEPVLGASSTKVQSEPYQPKGVICCTGEVFDLGLNWDNAKAKVYHSDPGDPSALPVPGGAVDADYVHPAEPDGEYRFYAVPDAQNAGQSNWVVVWIIDNDGNPISALTRKREFHGQTADHTECGYTGSPSAALSFADFAGAWQLEGGPLKALLLEPDPQESSADELVWSGGSWMLTVSGCRSGGHRATLAEVAADGVPRVYFTPRFHPCGPNQFTLAPHHPAQETELLVVRPAG